MTTSPDDALTEIRRTLTNWHATHPDASFLEMEEAVETQLHRLRASLLAEQTGAAQVEREEAMRQRLRREAPDGPPGPAVQQLSADGAMVPVTGGEWVEVRTIALGTVETDGEGMPHTRQLRYFSRLCSAA